MREVSPADGVLDSGTHVMSTVVRQFLESFDALPEAARHQAAVEILRRTAADEFDNLSDETLIGAADELFHDLDAHEAKHAAG